MSVIDFGEFARMVGRTVGNGVLTRVKDAALSLPLAAPAFLYAQLCAAGFIEGGMHLLVCERACGLESRDVCEVCEDEDLQRIMWRVTWVT